MFGSGVCVHTHRCTHAYILLVWIIFRNLFINSKFAHILAEALRGKQQHLWGNGKGFLFKKPSWRLPTKLPEGYFLVLHIVISAANYVFMHFIIRVQTELTLGEMCNIEVIIIY